MRPDFVLNVDNIEAVANICAQLDGLPLAIELVAARIRLMSPQALLTHLNAQVMLYSDGMRAVSARQKTLHGAIAWSNNLLSVEEQKLFAEKKKKKEENAKRTFARTLKKRDRQTRFIYSTNQLTGNTFT